MHRQDKTPDDNVVRRMIFVRGYTNNCIEKSLSVGLVYLVKQYIRS